MAELNFQRKKIADFDEEQAEINQQESFKKSPTFCKSFKR
jgi:hypothetical protein